MDIIRVIEIGFGTLSFTEKVVNGEPVIKTFASVVAPVSNDDLSGGLSKRDTVKVFVGETGYEVGPDAHLLSDRTSARVLNNTFIDTDQYKALFYGALVMMNEPVIDLLVLALPVNNMGRSEDLKAMAVGVHTIAGKEVNVKNVWVLCQPLAGYLYHATCIGQELFDSLKDVNVLSLDFGFSTADWLTTKGLKINDRRSGAVDMGMSSVLEETQKTLKLAFPHLDSIPLHLIDDAFWRHPGELKISGKSYPFPKCSGLDSQGNETKVKYDVTPSINKVTSSCMQLVRNNVGAGADIHLIVVMGGSHNVYMPEVKRTFPEHEIVVVKDPQVAVCLGMWFGALQYAQALKKKNAA